MSIFNKIKNHIVMVALIIIISAYSVYISNRYLELRSLLLEFQIKDSYYQGAWIMAFYRHCEQYNPDLLDLERLRGTDGFISCTGMNTYLDAFDDYNPELTDPIKPVEK